MNREERDANVIQTCFLCNKDGKLQQKMILREDGEEQIFFLPEVFRDTERMVNTKGGSIHFIQTPVRHYMIHLIHMSHHDRGYTGIPEDAVEMQAGNIKDAVRMLKETENYPEEEKFRFVLEQFWSLEAFWEKASDEEKGILIEAMKTGRAELTAMYGNMITEICSGEELLDSLIPSLLFAKEQKIRVIAAEHNDVPGFSDSLADALACAGIKVIFAGLPLYYDWGNSGLPSFWKEEEIFGYKGPGAFWWESRSGSKVLFWCGNSGCGGPARLELPGLYELLEHLQNVPYPYSHIRFVVNGGEMDNSGYRKEYCDVVREWNDTWAYPKMMMSTETMFYEAVSQELPDNLPVWKGGVPVQDYIAGTLSNAAATSQNRRNHSRIYAAEVLECMKAFTESCVPDENAGITRELKEARRDILIYDEHTFGFHFPAGPGCEASLIQKNLYSFRAASRLHDAAEKAKAALADHIGNFSEYKDKQSLIIFNPLPYEADYPISVYLRELDNAGQVLKKVGGIGNDYLKPAQCGNRMHVSPGEEYLKGKFVLLEAENGKKVGFDFTDSDNPMEPELYAAQRIGLSQGGRRYGIFEEPQGLRESISFLAENIPPFGWKMYHMVPAGKSVEETGTDGDDKKEEGTIENEFYRINCQKGRWTVYDKQLHMELSDQNRYQFGQIIICKEQDKSTAEMDGWYYQGSRNGKLKEEMFFSGSVLGHPIIQMRLTLYRGIRKISVAYSILKDNTPLLSCTAIFPFRKIGMSEYRYDGPLSVIEEKDGYLPGAGGNIFAVQGYLLRHSEAFDVVCCSADCAVFSAGTYSTGYLSPAHACVFTPQERGKTEENGYFYAHLFMNNFGTNFQVSQSGTFCFRFDFTTGTGMSEEECRKFAEINTTATEVIFKHPGRFGNLPASGGLTGISPKLKLIFVRLKESRMWIGLQNRSCDIVDSIFSSSGRKMDGLEIYEADILGTQGLKINGNAVIKPDEIKFYLIGFEECKKKNLQEAEKV